MPQYFLFLSHFLSKGVFKKVLVAVEASSLNVQRNLVIEYQSILLAPPENNGIAFSNFLSI